MQQVNVAMIGCGFMGKAHSNAYMSVGKFFDLPVEPVMKVVCSRHEGRCRPFSERWGWQEWSTDFRQVVRRPDVDLVDIVTPNDAHEAIVAAAAQAGKVIACEKPLARTVPEARRMLRAVQRAGVKTTVWFCYRRVPAIGLAKRLIDEGRIGRVYHWRASYLQDWIVDPKFPLLWRLDKKVAGSGSLGDIGAHIIDLAHYLVGELAEVNAVMETFVKKRPKGTGEGLSGKAGRETGEVTVDDATMFLARFTNGALGTFEATRFAAGRKNGIHVEINGSEGSLYFDFERMNELKFFSRRDPDHARGFRTILATEPVHPYMEAWWPPGHIIGYEHGFINQAADIFRTWGKDTPVAPDFAEAFRVQQVLEAVEKSARKRAWVKPAYGA